MHAFFFSTWPLFNTVPHIHSYSAATVHCCQPPSSFTGAVELTVGIWECERISNLPSSPSFSQLIQLFKKQPSCRTHTQLFWNLKATADPQTPKWQDPDEKCGGLDQIIILVSLHSLCRHGLNLWMLLISWLIIFSSNTLSVAWDVCSLFGSLLAFWLLNTRLQRSACGEFTFQPHR